MEVVVLNTAGLLYGRNPVDGTAVAGSSVSVAVKQVVGDPQVQSLAGISSCEVDLGGRGAPCEVETVDHETACLLTAYVIGNIARKVGLVGSAGGVDL